MKIQIILCVLFLGCADEQNLGFTAVGSPRWALSLGGAADDGAQAIAVDSIGDVVVVGYYGSVTEQPSYTGPLVFGNSPVTATGPGSFITMRVASDGSERWTKLFGQVALASATAVAIDADDSIVVVGSYQGPVDFGGMTLNLDEPTPPSHSDTFLGKYSTDGDLQWVRGLSPTTNNAAIAVAVDSSGRIVVAGTFSDGTIELAGQQYTNNNAAADTYLASFDPDGQLVWAHAFLGPQGGPYPTSVAVTPDGDVRVVGQFSASSSFGGSVLEAGAYVRAFIAHFQADGLYLDSGVLGTGGSGESYATQVAVDSTGDVIVQTLEAPELGESAIDTVHVLDTTDTEVWSNTIVDSGDLNPQERTLTTTPNNLIISTAWSTASMGVVAYDAAGTSGTTSFGTLVHSAPSSTMARGAATSQLGAVAIAGWMSGSIDFGTGALTTHGQDDQDAFVVLLDPPPVTTAPR